MKWEYKIVEPVITERQYMTTVIDLALLPTLGLEGWELVCVSDGGYMILKRPMETVL